MPPDKLKKLQTILKEINDGITRQEFVDSFKQVIAVVKDIKDTNASEWRLIHEAMKKIPDKMMAEMLSSMSATEKRMVKDCMSMCEKMCVEMDRKHSQEMAKMQLDIKLVKADREAIIEDTLARMPEDADETPEQIRDKLETLKGNERLDLSAIKGIEETVKKLEERIQAIPRGGLAPRSSNAMKPHKLTPDGSTKIFSVPKGVAGFVLLSDFPHVLIENAGYTINASRTQITLTVDNAPALNSQLLYVYASMFN